MLAKLIVLVGALDRIVAFDPAFSTAHEATAVIVLVLVPIPQRVAHGATPWAVRGQ